MRREWAILVLLALATFAVYFHALNQQFVNYDDPIYITLNAHLRGGLSWSSVGWAMSSWYANFYHPLTWLSHLLDVSLFDLKPQGHKLTNLLLHLANTLLVFAWLRTMTGAVVRSAIVAALFSLHPLHVESVVWVSQRKDLLSTLFLLLTLIAYTHYTRRPNPAGYLLVTFCLLLGLLAKPMLVTLPAVMLLLDVWPLNRGDDRRRWRRLIVEKLPWFALAAVFSIIAYLAQRRGEALASTEMFPLSARLANAAVSYARYLGRMFYPANLAPSYPHPHHWPATTVVGAVLLLIAITLIAWWTHKRKTYLLVGWLWFLGTLVPVIGLVQVGSHAMADACDDHVAPGLLIASGSSREDEAEHAGEQEDAQVEAVLLVAAAEEKDDDGPDHRGEQGESGQWPPVAFACDGEHADLEHDEIAEEFGRV